MLLFKYFKSFDAIITDVLKIYSYIIVDTSDLHPAMKMKFDDLKKAALQEVPNITMIGTLCLELISLRGQLNMGQQFQRHNKLLLIQIHKQQKLHQKEVYLVYTAVRNLYPYESFNFICQSIIWMKLSKRYSKYHYCEIPDTC